MQRLNASNATLSTTRVPGLSLDSEASDTLSGHGSSTSLSRALGGGLGSIEVSPGLLYGTWRSLIAGMHYVHSGSVGVEPQGGPATTELTQLNASVLLRARAFSGSVVAW